MLDNPRGCSTVIALRYERNIIAVDFTNIFKRVRLLLNLDVVIGGTHVNHLDVKILVEHDLVFDVVLVAKARLLTDILVDLRILREYLLHEEVPRESEGFNIGVRNVHKLSLGIADQVEVTEEVACD